MTMDNWIMITEIDLDVSPDNLRLRALNLCHRRHIPLVLKAVLYNIFTGFILSATDSSLLRRAQERSSGSIRKNPLTWSETVASVYSLERPHVEYLSAVGSPSNERKSVEVEVGSQISWGIQKRRCHRDTPGIRQLCLQYEWLSSAFSCPTETTR